MKTPLLAALVVLTSCNPLLTPVIDRQAQALTAETRPARVIWLVDKSGSMLLPADVTSPACPQGCGPVSPCPAACETRQTQLVSGINTLSAGLAASTTHAAVFFPTDALCGPPTSIIENISAAQVSSRAATAVPIGGTPTAAALNYVASLPPRAVETFVVLMTDGLPNCNENNPNHMCGTNPTPAAQLACQCTTATCGAINSLCSLGCLDGLATVNASHDLAAQAQHLMVIGVGSEVSTLSSASSLSALDMSLPRTCTTSADCAVGSCSNGECSERLFLASRAVDYTAPARRLQTAVKNAERCTWWLPHEVLASSLTVNVGSGVTDWSLSGDGEQQRVVITGEACTRLLDDASLTPQFKWLP